MDIKFLVTRVDSKEKFLTQLNLQFNFANFGGNEISYLIRKFRQNLQNGNFVNFVKEGNIFAFVIAFQI